MSFGDNGFGDISGDVSLGPTGTRNSGTLACTRSMAAPALRSASTSAACLTIRSPRNTSVANTGNSPRTSASGNRCSAGMESVTAVGTGAPPIAAHTSRYGSSPSTQSRTARPIRNRGLFSDANSSRGTTIVG